MQLRFLAFSAVSPAVVANDDTLLDTASGGATSAGAASDVTDELMPEWSDSRSAAATSDSDLDEVRRRRLERFSSATSAQDAASNTAEKPADT